MRADNFLEEIPLPLEHCFFPLGHPVSIGTNSEDVLRAAEECWGAYPQRFDGGPVRVALAVTSSGSRVGLEPSRFFAREHLMSMYANDDNFMLLDFERGLACGSVSRATAMDHPLLRYRFLIPGAHMLAEQRELTPFHAALVARNGRGVALTGESFAGKSTLAYACARAGWTYVTDDGTFLVREREDCYAVGDPNTLRLREGARIFFPELSDRLSVVRPNGKIAIEVLTKDLPIATAYGCSIEHVIFLARQDAGRARLAPFPREGALERNQQHIRVGTAEVRDAQLASLRRLFGRGVWKLDYSSLDDAIARLEQLVDTGA